MKVGFLLGSFDPIHMGHLHMVVSALNENLVDEVVVVPTMQNPWKDNKSSDFRHRCFMTQLAIDEIDNCSMSSIEYRVTEPYNSYKSLELLAEEYAENELYLIVGSDLVDSIKDWERGEWILNTFKLIVINRRDNDFKTPVDGYISNNINISSTEIRYLVKDGKQIYPMVPKVVSQYIKRYNLYK